MKAFTLLLLCLTALNVSCNSQSAATAASPAGRPEQWSGAYSEVTAPATRTIENEAAWTAVWKQAERPAPRPLNAAREMAVAVFVGERRTGGYTVEIASSGEQGGRFVVTYRENAPSRDVMVTQALTAPWAIAVIPRTKLPIVFEKLAPNQRSEK